MKDSNEHQQKVIVKSILLSELLVMNLTIPEYQRPYKWGEKEINKLLYQLKTHEDRKSEKPCFYLGSIVLHKDENGFYNIIDGQQRITTLSIIGLINQSINSNCLIKYSHPDSKSSIKQNYNLLFKKKEQLNEIDFAKINVTLVITNSQDEAYNFFETLNSGGVPLSGIHILKAHHLRRVPSNKIDDYAKAWEREQAYLNEVVKKMIYLRRWDSLNQRFVPSYKESDNIRWKEYFIRALEINESNVI